MDGNSSANNVLGQVRVKVTYGEALPNGAAIELVAVPPSEVLQLLYWDGQRSQVDLQIRYGDVLFQAPFLHPTIFQAVRFPNSAAEYASAERLFTNIVSVLQQWMGFDEEAAAGVTLWLRTSWLPELYPSPPLLCVTGLARQAMRLFGLLRSLCRHPLAVSELSRRLPFFLQVTLIIHDPSLSPKRQASWRACNHRGLFISENRGTLGNLACSKAVFSENEDFAEAWGPEALHLTLLPTAGPVPELTQSEEQQLAALYQPELLMYRLRTLPLIQQSGFATCPPEANSELARNLLVGLQDASGIVKAVIPLLAAYEEDLSAQRALDPKAVIVECLWDPAHESREIPEAELLKRMNSLLRNRGESISFSEKELGWKLRQLRIPRRRNGQGMMVRFSSQVRHRVHVLAQRLGPNLPRRKNCPDCKGSQTNVPGKEV